MLEILVLSEDAGNEKTRAVEKVIGKLVRGHDARGNRIVEIQPSNDRIVLEATFGNAWLSTRAKDSHQQIALVRTIADYIARDQVVVFHYDGDTRWSRRADTKTPTQFAARIRSRVKSLLVGPFPEDVADTKLANLIEATPFYSVEAWLYQAIDTAIALCEKHHRGAHTNELRAWKLQRAALDEVEKPKEAIALGSEHNGVLADALTTADVEETVAADASLAAFVRSLSVAPRIRDHVRANLGAIINREA